MDSLRKLGVCAALLLALGACQSFVGAFTAEDRIESAKNVGPPSGAFNAALQKEYVGISEVELDEYDFEHADTFARKGIAAGNGESVMPEDPASWTLPPGKTDEFNASRSMLVAALDGGGRSKAPGDAARAQAMYDCWIQEEETTNEGHQPEDIAACRKEFWDALSRVQAAIAVQPVAAPAPEPPPAPEPAARDYLVYFDFDKVDIRADTASILNRVVQAMAELGSNSVTLTGHTDTSGPSTYNDSLSVQRAFSVRDYLKSRGIGRGISTSGRGETDPRVPTPDGVKEQENRRVEIRIN